MLRRITNCVRNCVRKTKTSVITGRGCFSSVGTEKLRNTDGGKLLIEPKRSGKESSTVLIIKHLVLLPIISSSISRDFTYKNMFLQCCFNTRGFNVLVTAGTQIEPRRFTQSTPISAVLRYFPANSEPHATETMHANCEKPGNGGISKNKRV